MAAVACVCPSITWLACIRALMRSCDDVSGWLPARLPAAWLKAVMSVCCDALGISSHRGASALASNSRPVVDVCELVLQNQKRFHFARSQTVDSLLL